jgi:undecaprenyl diphosphate synthase
VSGLHVAVIMDGNGRWAKSRGLPRTFGHREGARSVRRIVEAAPALGVDTLTLYAFSVDNWKRPRPEVSALMRLFHRHLRAETAEMVERGIRLSVVGRTDRLPARVQAAVEAAETATRAGTRMHLRLAIDYSSRDSILAAVDRLRRIEGEIDRSCLQQAIGEVTGCPEGSPDVDLLIRTSGEQRLSDFLLWECAYAELVFSPVLWPDFTGDDLSDCLEVYRGRERRFGGVGPIDLEQAAG